MIYLGIATSAHAEQVSELRSAEYSRSDSYDIIDNSFLKWSADDDKSLVLAAWDQEERMLATMRGTIVRSLVEANDVAEEKFDSIEIKWPALLLRRAATAIEYRRSSLNSILRLHFFEMAFSNGLRHVIGSVIQGTSRTRLMTELGYQLYPTDCLTAGLVSKDKSLIAVIDLKDKIEIARQILINQVQGTQYIWRGAYANSLF